MRPTGQWAGLFTLLCATTAWGQETVAAPVDLMGEAVRVIGYLLLLVVLGAVVVRLGRKYAPQMGGVGPIRIEDGRNFSPGVGVRLIRVGTRAWLVGVSRDRVTLLAEMRPEDLLPVKDLPQ